MRSRIRRSARPHQGEAMKELRAPPRRHNNRGDGAWLLSARVVFGANGASPARDAVTTTGRSRTSASAGCLKTESGEDGARDRATRPMSSPRRRGPITTKRCDDEGKSCPAPNNTMVQGVWVPAFAGTAGERSRGRRESVRGPPRGTALFPHPRLRPLNHASTPIKPSHSRMNRMVTSRD